MAHAFSGRLSGRHQIKDTEQVATKPRKKPAMRKAVSVLKQNLPINTSTVKIESNLFGQLEFCVMNGDDEFSKTDLEMLLHQHGATTTQHPTHNTFAAIASREVVKVKNLIQQGNVDIIKTKWLLECVGQEVLVTLEPRYMIYSKPETRAIFGNDIDCHGDSYTVNTTVHLLREVFLQMDTKLEEDSKKLLLLKQAEVEKNNLCPLDHRGGGGRGGGGGQGNPSSQGKSNRKRKKEEQEEREGAGDPERNELPIPYKKRKLNCHKLEDKYFSCAFWSIFKNCNVYLDLYDPVNTANEIPQSCLEITRKILEFYSATVQPQIDHQTTHIIVEPTESPRLEQIKEVLMRISQGHPTYKRPFVVARTWVNESILNRDDLDERDFVVDVMDGCHPQGKL
eukprot:TRINITY_DN7421_c0_g1_i1.p1 TRINITY_DN7421_c0_g1~~TRINITY_DN7421_c0_g1_i1.p1  ORF type:complete len:395 (-),score=91.78 TRINITY_DN7421_c0_g1_i1:135-1319(-)